MFEFFWHLGSFILALGILVTVHEYGHFWVARKAGVKVLRFSIGFGKPLLKWHDKHQTEYVIAAIPLGGYVKMLDERVDDVPASERSLAFNNKSVLARIAIVLAGPMANFIFAVFALAVMYMVGVQSVKPVIGQVTPQSIAAEAGFQPDDTILSLDEEVVHSWQDVTFALMAHLGEPSLTAKVTDSDGRITYRTLALSQWRLDKQDEAPLTSIGITPYRPPLTLQLGYLEPGAAAEQAGLQQGDLLISLNGQPLESWSQFVAQIQKSANQQLTIEVERDQQRLSLQVIPQAKTQENGLVKGYLGVVPLMEKWPNGYIETRQYGLLGSMVLGINKTYDLITLSFDMIGNLLTGQVSVKNLSGPVGIAVSAGNSVSYGLVAFLGFLALISVNLGVFNLLPLPVLDGGHLMYYLIELIRRKPVSEKTQELGFKVGAMLLLGLTFFALFNDVSRL
ncbi:sigma E protease regulator RseP [Pseudoalteromonas sp. T1lg65]|uniref:sigma E protease regulator RseP n=1 Tax=Pseudoalteromonas sp. T1lg65 TaxID=2077101 RepID=UPI003F78B3E2